jgi:hypothetical protein
MTFLLYSKKNSKSKVGSSQESNLRKLKFLLTIRMRLTNQNKQKMMKIGKMRMEVKRMRRNGRMSKSN